MSYFWFSCHCIHQGEDADFFCVLRLFQCAFTIDRGTYQQYAIADAVRAIKVCVHGFSLLTEE